MKLHVLPAPEAPGRSLARAIVTGDYLRGQASASTGTAGYKEWFHFCVLAPGLKVLVNFSLADDASLSAAPGSRVPRLVALVEETGWDGDFRAFDSQEVNVRVGRVGVDFGDSAFGFEDGTYWVRARLPGRRIEIDLRLVPLAFPIASQNVAFSRDDPVRWLAVPRLEAHGTVSIRGRTHRIRRAPAYHDHNWGRFRWGGDFAWDWGFGLPEEPANPWSLVFVRLMDRARTRTLSQGLFLWKGDHPTRVLRGRDVRFRAERYLRQQHILKIPRVMGLVAEGAAADVPRSLELHGSGAGDRLEARIELGSIAQIVLPNDSDDLGTTTINETSGRMTLEGEVRGERVELCGPAIVEFVRA